MLKLAAILVVGIAAAILGCSSKNAESRAYSSNQMADGKRWLTENLRVAIDTMYCQRDEEKLCAQYGGLYTWQTAKKACATLGEGWRLPTDEEWKTMAKFYGGIVDDSNDNGKSAYVHLISGGDSGFNALLGGNKDTDGSYQRLEVHGFYWTSSEYDSTEAWFYNFAKGSTLLNHHSGNKNRAISVRCISD